MLLAGVGRRYLVAYTHRVVGDWRFVGASLGRGCGLLFPVGARAPRYAGARHSDFLPPVADGCIARMVRKLNGARLPADAALLLL
jgi:hypothetical protein